MSILGTAVAGEIGFGVFIATALVLIVMVTRFAISIAKKGRNKPSS